VVEASEEAMAFPVAVDGDAEVFSLFVEGSEDDEFMILDCWSYTA